VRGPLRFWGSALAAALAWAALVPVLFPFGALGLDRASEGNRIWMLVVCCTGVLAMLFAGGALLAGPRGVGARDVAEAGSVSAALEAARRTRGERRERHLRTRNFATWLVAFGGALVLIYFALLGALG
jgi:hypothetical protein